MPSGVKFLTGSCWFRPKIPRKRKCMFCGLHALHKSRADCLQEMREERAVLLANLKQRERVGGVLLCCPWCRRELRQTDAARTVMEGRALMRVYQCDRCRCKLVTRETPTVTSLYVSSGLVKPPKGRAAMLDWDEKMIRQVFEDAAKDGVEVYDEEGGEGAGDDPSPD